MPNWIENLLYLGVGMLIVAGLCCGILFAVGIAAAEFDLEDGKREP